MNRARFKTVYMVNTATYSGCLQTVYDMIASAVTEDVRSDVEIIVNGNTDVDVGDRVRDHICADVEGTLI